MHRVEVDGLVCWLNRKPETHETEWLDVDADGAEVGTAGATEEADDAAPVLNGDTEMFPCTGRQHQRC
jgi:hypothetical protein